MFIFSRILFFFSGIQHLNAGDSKFFLSPYAPDSLQPAQPGNFQCVQRGGYIGNMFVSELTEMTGNQLAGFQAVKFQQLQLQAGIVIINQNHGNLFVYPVQQGDSPWCKGINDSIISAVCCHVKIMFFPLFHPVSTGCENVHSLLFRCSSDGLNQRGVILGGKRRAEHHNHIVRINQTSFFSGLVNISHIIGSLPDCLNGFLGKMHVGASA